MLLTRLKHARAAEALVNLRKGNLAYGAPQARTPEHKERLGQDLEQLIYQMQDMAEHMECLGAIDVFVILDSAAERLRELTR